MSGSESHELNLFSFLTKHKQRFLVAINLKKTRNENKRYKMFRNTDLVFNFGIFWVFSNDLEQKNQC
jgi:hypothetical protein